MIRLLAQKAKMGVRTYFIATMGLGEVARWVQYREAPKDWPPELLAQRKLNRTRVKKDMVPYLVDSEDHFYGALVVEHVRHGEPIHDVRFREEENGWGWIELDGSETLEVGDGQHRLASIQQAVEQRPELASERIAVIIVPHIDLEHSQQLFSDLNRNAKPTPKSLNILFEHREPEAISTREVAKASVYLSGKVAFTGSNLSSKSPYLVTLATFYNCTRKLSEVIEGEENPVQFMVRVWDEVVFPSLPQMNDLKEGKIRSSELRSRYIYATTLGIESLSDAVAACIKQYPGGWEKILRQGLTRIKWDLSETMWEGIAWTAGRLAAGAGPRRRTATMLKHLLGLKASDEHVKDLREALWHKEHPGSATTIPSDEELPKLPSPVVNPLAV